MVKSTNSHFINMMKSYKSLYLVLKIKLEYSKLSKCSCLIRYMTLNFNVSNQNYLIYEFNVLREKNNICFYKKFLKFF